VAVLLATCADLPDGDEDARLLLDALADEGVDAHWAVWTDREVDWAADLVVIRSTWDYTFDRASFLTWAHTVPRLVNPVAIVEWNSDKTYLRDLREAGVPVVHTEWAAPGEDPRLPETAEFVVKPSVGAGSRGAGRFLAASAERALEHAAVLQRAGRTVMVQPYLAGVDAAGERALVYVDAAFSHAVTKGAMLPQGTVHGLRDHSLYVDEVITPAEPTAAERAVGDRALAAVLDRFGTAPLYARVDLLPSESGPVVVELELTEPSLFLGYADGAAGRFAAAVAARAGTRR
jgi:glutathione synthase/RimK-type ligase-like ATP-grasp enzyme